MEAINPELINKLRIAKKVVVLTGAGVSNESGIPTFREAQTGLWAKYDPGELATPEAFKRDPGLVWRWYQWRRKLISESNPNTGHHALVQLEKLLSGFTLITQNVDGFHRLAGSQNVLELHGNIQRNICINDRDQVEGDFSGQEAPPHCPRCGAYIRPDVVWFGEQLPGDMIDAAFEASRHADVFLSIGTSGVVYPAASLPQIAKQNGALLVEINTQETALSHMADHVLPGLSGEVLPELIHQFMEKD